MIRRYATSVAFLDDTARACTTTCERALLNKMGGGCQVPIGAFAESRQRQIASGGDRGASGRKPVSCGNQVTARPARLGEMLGEGAARRGGDAILQEVYGKAVVTPQQP